MMASQRLEILHESQVGHARRVVHQAALRLGGDGVRAGQAAIVATELATNLVKHGRGGEILLRELREGTHCGLELHALDRGPGMPDVAACLQDGYSTVGTAGTGLGAIQRLAGQFGIYSHPGQGTVVWVRFPVTGNSPAGGHFTHSGISVALEDGEWCGDAWDVRESPDGLRVLLADGLGHGPLAAVPAVKAVSVFRQHGHAAPAECLALIDQALSGTRGAAASAVAIDRFAHRVTAAGVGNVMVRLLRPGAARTCGGENGTLGGGVRKIMNIREPWDRDSVLVLHSDGISSRWGLDKYPGLIGSHCGVIAGVLHRDFRKAHDDSSVVVARQTS